MEEENTIKIKFYTLCNFLIGEEENMDEYR